VIGYTVTMVCDLLDINYGRFQSWHKKEYVFPTNIGEYKHVDLYTCWDIYGIELFKTLLDLGFSCKISANVYSQWQNIVGDFDEPCDETRQIRTVDIIFYKNDDVVVDVNLDVIPHNCIGYLLISMEFIINAIENKLSLIDIMKSS